MTVPKSVGIRLRAETFRRLLDRLEPNDTYDDCIVRLLDRWDEARVVAPTAVETGPREP